MRNPTVTCKLLATTFCLLAVLAACRAQAYVGDWTSYTHLNEIRDVKPAKGFLWIATSGGIRRLGPDNSEKVYRNTEGLRDVGIQGLAVTPEGEVWASSELGFVYHLQPDLKGWDIEGTSYKSSAWAMNRRALTYRAGYLVLGSQKGLTFFNTALGLAEANVTKMGKANDMSVNSLLFVGDTLFAGTSKGIFRATLHMDKLLSDPQINIFNPAIWSLIPGSDALYSYDPAKDTGNPVVPAAKRLAQAGLAKTGPLKLPQAKRAAAADSSNPVDSVPAVAVPGVILDTIPPDADSKLSHGLLFYGPKGIASEYAGGAFPDANARVSQYGGLFLDGKSFPNTYHMECVAKFGGRWFAGNAFFLNEVRVDSVLGYIPIQNAEDIPPYHMTALRATPYGLYGWDAPSAYRFRNGLWENVGSFFISASSTENERRGLHTFEVTDPNHIYLGSWGEGFYTQINGEQKRYLSDNTCIESAVESAPNYVVLESQATFQNRGIWVGRFKEANPYRLAFFDFATQSFECFQTASVDLYPRNLQIVGDSVLVVVTERGVDAYPIRTTSGRVSIGTDNLFANLPKPDDPPLAAKADKQGNLWVTTEGSTLLYLPAVQFGSGIAQDFHTLDGFPGSSCFNAERDPQGHIWIGCTEGGIIEVTPGKDTLSHTFRHYGLTEGLVSETVYHLDVDQGSGEVWVATDKGLSKYQSASRPALASLSGLKVYPNPFLPKHSAVIFDNLAAGSDVDVLTQAGSVVWHRALNAGDGGQIRWNGRNRADERVKEGVYFYVVRSGSDVRHGKIIVAR